MFFSYCFEVFLSSARFEEMGVCVDGDGVLALFP
jgi:hypothetical protein